MHTPLSKTESEETAEERERQYQATLKAYKRKGPNDPVCPPRTWIEVTFGVLIQAVGVLCAIALFLFLLALVVRVALFLF